MTLLPTSLSDCVIAKSVHKEWLNNCVEGKITLPSHNTNGLMFYGNYGCGKTLLANALPIFIEYEQASAKDRTAYNFCYDYNGTTISITPNQQHLKKFAINTYFHKCGSLRASDVDALVNRIDTFMLNQTDVDGDKQGVWTKSYKNGKVRYKGQFKNNKPFGLFYYYQISGELQAEKKFFHNGTAAATHIFEGKV